MRFTIHRTGGFAGLNETVAGADTAQAAPAQAAKLKHDWAALRSRIKAAARTPSVGADYLQYEIVTQDESGEERLRLIDDGNEVVAALLAFAGQFPKPGAAG